MWSVILSKITQRYLGYLTLPVAVVVGTIGYKIEQRLSKPKQIPYLDHSVLDERLQREMGLESVPALKDFNLLDEKNRIVPKSSLNLNTSRNFDNKS